MRRGKPIIANSFLVYYYCSIEDAMEVKEHVTQCDTCF